MSHRSMKQIAEGVLDIQQMHTSDTHQLQRIARQRGQVRVACCNSCAVISLALSMTGFFQYPGLTDSSATRVSLTLLDHST